MEQGIYDFLIKIPLLSGLDPEVIEALASVAERCHFDADQVIIQDGTIGHEMYIIVEGNVEVSKGEGEDLMLLATRGSGDLIGEMSLIEGRPRFGTVRTLEKTSLLQFTESDLRSVWIQQPKLMLRIVTMLSHRLRESDTQMIADLTQTNVELRRAYHDLKEAQAAVVEKERLERELELARDLQQSILPDEFPSVPGVSFAASSRPARQVGGDFYDVIPMGSGRAGLVMADVSDKGMPAALFMALTRSLIRAEVRRSSSPRSILMSINQLLLEISQSDMFVTVFFGVLDMAAGMLRYARAGHDKPILINTLTGACKLLGGGGIALGVIDRVDLEELEVEVHAGDMLLLYTDGIPDANSRTGEIFGLKRFQDIACKAGHVGAFRTCESIFDQVRSFMGDNAQFDDMALLVVSFDI